MNTPTYELKIDYEDGFGVEVSLDLNGSPYWDAYAPTLEAALIRLVTTLGEHLATEDVEGRGAESCLHPTMQVHQDRDGSLRCLACGKGLFRCGECGGIDSDHQPGCTGGGV